jgi:hypothetical protein
MGKSREREMTMKRAGRLIALSLAVSAPLCWPDGAAAFLFTSETTHVDVTQTARRMADCGQFKLKEVQVGPAQELRTYWFNGVCRIWIVKLKGGKAQGTTGETSLWAEAKATWNAKSNALEERVKLTDPAGKHSGGLESSFKCTQDPIVQKTNCVRLSFKNMTDWTGFAAPTDKNRPMLAGHATAAEAGALAKSVVAPPPSAASAVPPLPSVSRPAVAAAAVDLARKRAASALPDLRSGPQLTVAGKYAVAWGGTVQFTDADARAAANGVCRVAFEHQVHNAGTAGSAASSRRWAIEGMADGLIEQTPAIAAGGVLARVDTLPLRPGVNKLRLNLDSLEQVAEGDESNNLYTLVVTLSGLCGGLPPDSPQAAGSPGSLRWAPAQRGPGDDAAASQPVPPAGRLKLPPPAR